MSTTSSHLAQNLRQLRSGRGLTQARAAALAEIPRATWAHLGNGWVFSAANGGWEYPAFLALATVVQALLGSGAYSLKLGTSSRHSLSAA